MSLFEKELEGLKAPMAEERIAALEKLGNEGDEAVIDAVITATTSDKSPLVRFHARRALAHLRRRHGEDFIRVGMTITNDSGAFDAESFKKALEHDNFMYRYTAIKGVEKLRDDAALPIMAQALAMERNPIVRSAGVKAMAKVAGEMATEEILIYLNDPDGRVRANAVEALLACGADVTDFLQPMLNDSEPRVKANTIVALHGRGGLGLPEAAAALARGDVPSREAAIWAMEQIRSDEMVEALKILLVSDDLSIRSRAEKIAAQVGISIPKSSRGATSYSDDQDYDDDHDADDDQDQDSQAGSGSSRGAGKGAGRGAGRGSGKAGARGGESRGGRSSGSSRKPSAILGFLKVVTFLIVLGALGYGGFFYYQKFDQERSYNQALELMNQNQLDKASLIFNRLIGYRDSRDMLRRIESLEVINKAENYLRKSMFREALEAYRAAMGNSAVDKARAKDGLRRTFVALVKDRRDAGDVDGSVRWCDEALISFPQDLHFINARRDTLMGRARELIAKGLFSEALAFIKSLPERGVTEGADSLLNEARIQYAQGLDRAGKVEEAIVAYADLLNQPGSQGSGDGAGKGSLKINELEDAHARLLSQKIGSQVKSGDSLAGVMLARDVLKKYPDRAEIRTAAVQALGAEASRMGRMGDLKRAVALVSEAEAILPGDKGISDVKSQLSNMEKRAEDPSNRTQNLKKTIAYIIESGEKDTPQGKQRLESSYMEMASALLDQIKLEEAAAVYREGLKHLPGDQELSKALASVYLRLGDDRYAGDLFDEAQNFYSLAKKTFDSPEARKALESTRIKDTYISYLSGDYETAEKGFREILADEPDHSKARKGLALCLKERGESAVDRNKFQEAWPLFSEAYELQADTKGLSELLADTTATLSARLAKEGKFDQASALLEKAKKQLPDSKPVTEAVTALYVARAEQEKMKKLAVLEEERQKQAALETERRERMEREQRIRAEKAKELEMRSKVFFSSSDTRGDDKGAGAYKYPDIDGFDQGQLDIVRAEALADGDHVLFRITYDKTIETSYSGSGGSSDDRSRSGSFNWRRGENGWVFQMVDIYIDTDRRRGSGETRTLPGRNLTIDPSYAWERVVLISPLSATEMDSYINSKMNNSDFIEMKNRVIVPRSYSVQGSVITARVPMSQLGRPGLDWAWQFMSLCYADTDSPYNMRNLEVSDVSDENHFGGGTSFYGDTNVIDLLMPNGTDQFRSLSNYTSRPDYRQNRFAVVPMVDWESRNP